MNLKIIISSYSNKTISGQHFRIFATKENKMNQVEVFSENMEQKNIMNNSALFN